MSWKRPGISLAIALAAGLTATSAQAIYLNTETFRAAGGDPNNIAGTIAQGTLASWKRSLQAPFDAVGDVPLCTGTFIGNDYRHAWVLTAAHCVGETWQHYSISTPMMSASGWSRVYRPPKYAAGIAWDIALVSVPLHIPGTPQWNAVTKPLLYDGNHEVGRAVHLVGHGETGIGQTGAWTAKGRLWGTSRVVGAFAGETGLVIGYAPHGATDLQARTASGDSGSAWWQQHAGGLWSIVAVTSTGNSKGSNGTRVNRHVEWIKSVFPGAATLSERFTVTEKQSFVSRNHAEDVNTAVYYVLSEGQYGVNGPTFGIRGPHYLGTHSKIRVTAKDAITGEERPIVLRGSRDSGCGDVQMSNAVSCNWMRMGPLKLAYHAEDNVGLPSGEWKARFDVNARGWHHTYRERLPISVDIRNVVQGTVSHDKPWHSPNFAAAASHGSVYYVVPPQARATGPAAGIWNGQRIHSTLRVLAREASTGFERQVTLRTSRNLGCGNVRMEDAMQCNNQRMGPLNVSYHAMDNKDLPAGAWRGVAYVRVKGWHDPAVDEAIRLDVAIDR